MSESIIVFLLLPHYLVHPLACDDIFLLFIFSALVQLMSHLFVSVS